MSPSRAIAIVLGALLLLAMIVLGAGYFWLQAQAPKFKAAGKAVLAEATEFGKSTDNQGCLEESLERDDRCDGGFRCHVLNNLFFLQCLKVSSPLAGFCDGVPGADSFTETVAWRLDQCEQRGRTGTSCGTFFGQMQEYCASLSPEPAGDERS